MQLIGHHTSYTEDLCHLNKQEELRLLNWMKFTAEPIMLVIVIQRVLISKSDFFFNSLQLIVAVSPFDNQSRTFSNLMNRMSKWKLLKDSTLTVQPFNLFNLFSQDGEHGKG